MPSFAWNAGALADGDAVTATNLNNTGNGDVIAWGASGTGGAAEPFTGAANTYKIAAVHDASGDGFSFGGGVGAGARLDTGVATSGAELFAIEFDYDKLVATTTADNALIAGRNANATPAFNGYLYDLMAGGMNVRNAGGTNLTSAVSGSATTGAVPSMPIGKYKVKLAYIRNTTPLSTTATSSASTITANAHGMAVGDRVRFTALGGMTGVDTSTLYYVVTVSANTFQVSATSGGAAISLGTGSAISFVRITTANGRMLCQIVGITDPTWNGGEYWIDTGYTANITVDKPDRARIGKTTTTGAYTTLNKIRKWRWYMSDTPNTSLTKTEAVKNFVPATGPSVSTADTGDGYTLRVIGTAIAGGALTYSITQTGGTTFNPISLGSGAWKVQRDTAGTRTYDITVSEAGGSPTVTTLVVPAAQASAGKYQILVRVGGAWV